MESGDVLWMARLQTPKADDPSPGIVTMVKLGDNLIAATAGRIFALHASTGVPLRKAPLPHATDPQRLILMTTTSDDDTVSVPCGVATCVAR